MAAYAVGVVTPMDSSKSATMTCQVYAGNARVWAYSCPYLTPIITSFSGFPRPGSRRYTQVRANRKSRHFGRDAEIQAMDGNQSVVQALDSVDLPSLSLPSEDTRASLVSHSLPSLDAGFWHPCRNDGPPTLVYNDESPSLGTCQSNDLRISIDSDRGKIYLKTLVLSLNEGRGF